MSFEHHQRKLIGFAVVLCIAIPAHFDAALDSGQDLALFMLFVIAGCVFVLNRADWSCRRAWLLMAQIGKFLGSL